MTPGGKCRARRIAMIGGAKTSLRLAAVQLLLESRKRYPGWKTLDLVAGAEVGLRRRLDLLRRDPAHARLRPLRGYTPDAIPQRADQPQCRGDETGRLGGGTGFTGV
jgi:hypothetical protein